MSPAAATGVIAGLGDMLRGGRYGDSQIGGQGLGSGLLHDAAEEREADQTSRSQSGVTGERRPANTQASSGTFGHLNGTTPARRGLPPPLHSRAVLAKPAPEYELILMLDPEAPDERRDAITVEARKRIEAGTTLKQERTWGVRQMAYEIDHRTEADYRFFRFEQGQSVLDDLNHNLRITDGILRYRIFKVDPTAPVVDPPPPINLAATAAPRPGGRGGRDDRPPRGPDQETEAPPAAPAAEATAPAAEAPAEPAPADTAAPAEPEAAAEPGAAAAAEPAADAAPEAPAEPEASAAPAEGADAAPEGEGESAI